MRSLSRTVPYPIMLLLSCPLRAVSMPPLLQNLPKAFALPTCTSLHLRLCLHSSTTASALYPSQAPLLRRSMSTHPRISQSHEERTAEEPRGNAIHTVVLSKISQVNPTIRLLQLRIPNGRRIRARLFPSKPASIAALTFHSCRIIQAHSWSHELTSYSNSTVPRRSMARRTYSLTSPSRGLYNNFYTP